MDDILILKCVADRYMAGSAWLIIKLIKNFHRKKKEKKRKDEEEDRNYQERID